GIRDLIVTGVQTCALPICPGEGETPYAERDLQFLVVEPVDRLGKLLLLGRDRLDIDLCGLPLPHLGVRDPGVFLFPALLRLREKIGRASCRERVWITGGAA